MWIRFYSKVALGSTKSCLSCMQVQSLLYEMKITKIAQIELSLTCGGYFDLNLGHELLIPCTIIHVGSTRTCIHLSLWSHYSNCSDWVWFVILNLFIILYRQKSSRSYYHHVDSKYPLSPFTLPEQLDLILSRQSEGSITWYRPHKILTHRQIIQLVSLLLLST